ncbi:hypothetical protein [Pontibacter lucknowensis]|uniref:Uncharacterized protein n=1 Tax=Pontibacter lucknowensis TaxID=1077936 RepID=A0A1N7BJ37_9BACT|nr:hypothetical protein [Pontibacter lucknowensis]SIR51213.1 hypothetical protein SAMN05421545_3978 [Pontibacter lucknowensis]
MKKIFEQYHEKFSIEINQPKSKVMETIAREKGKKRDLASILGIGLIDYKEVKLTSENSVEIEVNPKMFNPYRGAGKINITFNEGESGSETTAEGEMIPYTGAYFLAISIFLSFLVFLTLFALVTDSGTLGVVIVVGGWFVILTFLYLLPFWYRRKLREYRDSFMTDLKANRNKKKSIR